MKWLLLALGGAAAAFGIAYRIEDPFLKRRDRAAIRRMGRLLDRYELQPWVPS